jgi:hypothetical protein
MKTIETTAIVSADHRLTLQLQLSDDVPPGEHHVLVTIADSSATSGPLADLGDWPVHEAGLMAAELAVRCEDLYGEAGR